jgi:carboxylesterase
MFDAAIHTQSALPDVRCPLLLFTSPQDHVVPPGDSDYLAGIYGGPVERVSCDRSYHVATLDYDKEMIIEESMKFVRRVSPQ